MASLASLVSLALVVLDRGLLWASAILCGISRVKGTIIVHARSTKEKFQMGMVLEPLKM